MLSVLFFPNLFFLTSSPQGTDISPSCYEKTILWIAEISSQFQLHSETFALSISILNRLLASVKVKNLFQLFICLHYWLQMYNLITSSYTKEVLYLAADLGSSQGLFWGIHTYRNHQKDQHNGKVMQGLRAEGLM